MAVNRVSVPVLDGDRWMNIADIRCFDLDQYKDPCKARCLMGECPAPRTVMGCGGCCGCMGGCFAEYENGETAPHLWEGDYA